MSPSDPPLGLPVETVLAPNEFCDAVPNVVACMLSVLIFNPPKVLLAGLYASAASSVSIYCLLYPELFCAENVI